MKEKVKQAVGQFELGLLSLKEGASGAASELEKDGVIQRFEFTFELFWKCLKIYLEHEGISCKTPRECLKSAFRIGLISDEAVCLAMLEDRNRLSHIYDKIQSEKIFAKITSEYIRFLEGVLQKIELTR